VGHPSITGVGTVNTPPGGSVTHGSLVNISNPNQGTFGLPTVYDDFSVGTLGAHIVDTAARIGTWDHNDLSTQASPTYSTAQTRGVHTRCADHHFAADQANGNVDLSKNVAMANGQSAYFDWWMLHSAYSGDNYKILRWWGNPYPSIEMNWVYGFSPGNLTLQNVPVDGGNVPTSNGLGDDSGFAFASGVWRHYQLIQRLGTTIANDRFWGQVNGSTKNDLTGHTRFTNSPGFADWRLGYFQHSPYAHMYSSCVFMKFGEARVECSNNANYAAAGVVREIQPHDTWTPSLIRIPKFNKGMLSNGAAWLHVVQGGFTASLSVPITIG